MSKNGDTNLNARRRVVFGAAAVVSMAMGPGAAVGQPVANDVEMLRRQTGNLNVVRRYATAWTAGNRAAIGACYHPEFTLHYFGSNPLSGDHVGLKASVATLIEFGRRTNRRLISVVDAFAGPERAVLIARERFTRGELDAELERLFVYTIKEERLHHCWIYDSDQALVDRFLA
ncbi:hypothetical protein BH11PSE11_BH11PSE11_18910 [soil metagenome]